MLIISFNKNIKKGMVKFLAVGTIFTSLVATTAFATTNEGYEVINGQARAGLTSGDKDGGYWIRGKSGTLLKSEYKHYKESGHASVVNGEGDYDEGEWEEANVFSKSKAGWTSSGTNKAYYDHS